MPYGASLDGLNLLLADVRGGLGPYVSVFLFTEAHWHPATIGLVLTVSGIIGISVHAPVGALIDATRAKRGLIIAGVAGLSACALGIAWAPTLAVVLTADVVMAVLGAVFATTVAAITLGLVERSSLAARLGRSAAFDRIGNLFVAAVSGAVGTAFGRRAVVYLVPFFAVWTVIAVLSIPGRAIDHEQARGLLPRGTVTRPDNPASWRVLVSCKPLLVLAAVAALFHFANAAMLPLVSQKLALGHPGRESVRTAAAIIMVQIVIVAMALLVARSKTFGRKPLLLTAIAALALRGVLFAVSDNAAWLIAVQALDGVGIGLFDALMPLVLADILRGTGRYSVGRGLVGTVQGVGGSLSQAAAGLAVVQTGHATAFIMLAGVALMALVPVQTAMPETRSEDDATRGPGAFIVRNRRARVYDPAV